MTLSSKEVETQWETHIIATITTVLQAKLILMNAHVIYVGLNGIPTQKILAQLVLHQHQKLLIGITGSLLLSELLFFFLS